MPQKTSEQQDDIFCVKRVVAAFGSPADVRKALGITYDGFKKWRVQGIPLRYHLAIEELSGGKVTVEMLAESRGLRVPGARRG